MPASEHTQPNRNGPSPHYLRLSSLQQLSLLEAALEKLFAVAFHAEEGLGGACKGVVLECAVEE